MMARKVRLYTRIRRTDNVDAYVDPVWNRNRTLRSGYAMVGGQAEHHPEGIYYLRYARSGKRVWEAVGKDAEVALVALRNVEHDLTGVGLGRLHSEAISAPGGLVPSEDFAVTVADATAAYLQEVRTFKAKKTISACELMLGKFAKATGSKRIKQIKRTDLLEHMARLKDSKLGARTVFNHMARITTLLKANDVTGLLRPSDWPRYDEKAVDAYHPEELVRLFLHCTPEERLLFEFFIGSGFREQEVMYSTWANVDFRSKIVSVWSKPEFNFKVKDSEERSVPVSDVLIEALAKRKLHSSSMLIFPGKNKKPNGHFLRDLQRIAFRAGLNCGECLNRAGTRCSGRPGCRLWTLHKLRRTYGSMHSEAGVSPTTIQRLLGHSDLATTMRYLAAADLRSERTRAQVNASFAVLSAGRAA